MTVLLSLLLACGPSRTTPEDWEVYALDYGRSTYKRAKLVQGGSGPREPFAWMAWLIVGPERTILVDTGFSSEKLVEDWKIVDFRAVPSLLDGLHIAPESITDVIISHPHWDHMGNVSPYGNADLWIQGAGYDWAAGQVADVAEKSGARRLDLQVVDAAGARLKKVDADAEIAPGIWVHAGGGHTPGMQWVEIRDGARTVVLASDIAYLYENIEREIPPGGSKDPAADAAQIGVMRAAASEVRLVIPGHDPRVFDRFETAAPRAVYIR